ncbi:UDP-N-acetylglucosamine 1-carboxyvinyltransferase [Synechococcus sp. CS-602]|uniref:UDP-N-acetylglucosamine 1-carboxyvinyltransferase n=1 Tax=Synechococcaceae TaxID=1890426 RepID=UPI0008FF31FE|nr:MULTISPECIES: UDP-N-acetylglucosamine 1-carboxyvinyltransferase [Synechococcaceae]MCT4365589.1 UDP-N-acetylglucosamine 1-carboxyvinyltransferase [Candidatus Regnicoccus frigidus MAG-AL1]APD47417.1 UDP-N-acetylglucosamine 1-carboxyvinyltransferase [Synechococcus sp. SynAce01]MCT0202657.1 UDP-N-acetylglucosamine 1-carboxyvinyltransferase [Synechococcus sp. CS-603]MCT0204461.1 UDP-N-acetylglucosamine 1-carboxyvinyltransferase [Synechococcus sp. CS-602]MCT0247303.1 UDP-N-acetylglucosamine 1-car
MPLTATVAPQLLLTPQLEISGGRRLAGEVRVNGAKNSALVLMAACLLTKEPLRLSNVPPLTDIAAMGEILMALGVKVKSGPDWVELDASHLSRAMPPYELVSSLRASFFCIGPLLARLGVAKIPMPGGCQIGSRPVAVHVKGLKALGAQVVIEHGIVSAAVPGRGNRLSGGRICLDCPSVGATETLMMAAALADGETVIENAALEPEVVDLAGLLVAMGGEVHGAGTPTITIVGVKALHGADYAVIPDRIEAGTLLLAAAITRSELTVGPIATDHLSAVITKLEDAGCSFTDSAAGLTIHPGDLRPVDICTQPFPGFPTDLQAPFMSLLATIPGTSMVVENIFENRLQHVAELQRMGANIRLNGNTALVEGVPQLSGAPVKGTDLRASAAMVLAGLAAEGTTAVQGLCYLDRGYSDLEGKLNSVGAAIRRVEV